MLTSSSSHSSSPAWACALSAKPGTLLEVDHYTQPSHGVIAIRTDIKSPSSQIKHVTLLSELTLLIERSDLSEYSHLGRLALHTHQGFLVAWVVLSNFKYRTSDQAGTYKL